MSKSISSVLEKEDEEDLISKPFKSEAQRKKFHAMEAEGKISKETVAEWEAHTKGKKLPKKKDSNMSKSDLVDVLKAVSAAADLLTKASKKKSEEDDKEEDEENAMEIEVEVKKALTSSVVSSYAKQVRMHEYAAGAALEQGMGTMRTRPDGEPPVVPVRHIDTPESTATTFEVFTSCNSCSLVHKSTSGCPRCERNRNITESGAVRFRG